MAVDTDELRGLANDCAKDGLHTVAEQLRADADEIDRLNAYADRRETHRRPGGTDTRPTTTRGQIPTKEGH